MLAESTGLFAAVRMGVCGEWVDHTTASSLHFVAEAAASATDARNPRYAAAKPFVRIARVEIKEVES
jgi:hypothetical protein